MYWAEGLSTSPSARPPQRLPSPRQLRRPLLRPLDLLPLLLHSAPPLRQRRPQRRLQRLRQASASTLLGMRSTERLCGRGRGRGCLTRRPPRQTWFSSRSSRSRTLHVWTSSSSPQESPKARRSLRPDHSPDGIIPGFLRAPDSNAGFIAHSVLFYRFASSHALRARGSPLPGRPNRPCSCPACPRLNALESTPTADSGSFHFRVEVRVIFWVFSLIPQFPDDLYSALVEMFRLCSRLA